MTGQIARGEISRIRPRLKELALKIWNKPEPPFYETCAARWAACRGHSTVNKIAIQRKESLLWTASMNI